MKKTFKKALSLITSILIIASFAVLGVSADSTNPSFDALTDFNVKNEGPVWFYEVTNAEGAWEKVTEYHEEWDGFFGIGAYANAGVYGGVYCAGLAPSYDAGTGIAHDSSYKFVCPESGEIVINKSKLESKSDPSAKGLDVSMIHNEQKIWSAIFDKSGVDAAGKEVPEQKLTVKKGDVIRFKGHSLDTTAGNNGSFVWDIKVNYTKVDDGKSTTTTSTTTSTTAKPVNLTFHALKDFNSKNNGPVWFYEVTNAEGAWEKVTEYHEEWDGFFGIGAYANAGVYGGASCTGLAPSYDAATGIAHDASFKFVCPESGEIIINKALLESKSDPSAKGLEVSILHNNKKVWSTNFDKSGVDASGKEVPEQKLTVKKGDIIRFKAHSLDKTAGNNGSFVWDLKINYTKIEGGGNLPITGEKAPNFIFIALSVSCLAVLIIKQKVHNKDRADIQ